MPVSMPLVFVDLETTGATAAADRITEIGIVEVSAAGVSEWSSLVNPRAHISSFIERLTGISNEMVADAPPFEALAEEVHERLKGRLFVAHNARFDYGFLKNEFARLGIDFRATVLCTVRLSRALFPEHRQHNLDALISRHGLVVDGRHRALADARLIHQFWTRLRGDLPLERIDGAVRELIKPPTLPPQLDAQLIDDLPEGHGVYLFYGEDNVLLFVGKSTRLKRRVLSHFSGDPASAKNIALAQQVRRVDWRETAGEIGAQLQEAELLRLRPTLNRYPKGSDELCAWQLVDAGGGDFRPRLVHAHDPELDFASAPDLYGLFASPREARRALTQIATDQGLCPLILGLEDGVADRLCFAQRVGKCRGACAGREPPSMHGARLLAALARQKLLRWPFAGPALLREGRSENDKRDYAHVIDRWRYLGTATCDDDLHALLDARLPAFDRDTYRLLLKHAGRLSPLPTAVATRCAPIDDTPPEMP